jgi:two-component system, NarL family, response regulator LiaR
MKLGIISPRILIRRALSTFLASTGTALVVLEGSNLLENLEEVKGSQADTLIFDVCGPWGVEGLSELSKLGVSLRVLVLMDDLDHESCVRALQLGAWGCLSTKQSPLVFQKALTAVSRGERWIPQQAINETTGDLLEKKSPAHKTPEELTPREWEVLGLLANGFRNKEISSRLSISEETAKSHIKSIYRKLKIKGRRDAIFHYFEYVHRPHRQRGHQSRGTG